MALIHQHIVIRAHLNKPPKSEDLTRDWLRNLISAIGMNILHGPHAVYLDKEGNRGITAVCIIETSHIAMHVWDEGEPALVQLDVYSCKDFDKEIVFKFLDQFEPTFKEWFMLDREHTLEVTEKS